MSLFTNIRKRALGLTPEERQEEDGDAALLKIEPLLRHNSLQKFIYGSPPMVEARQKAERDSNQLKKLKDDLGL